MRKSILGVNVDFDMNLDELVDKIDKRLQEDGNTDLIATTSPFFIMAAQEDPEFKDVVNNAWVSTPDGIGLLYANYYLNKIKNYKRDVLFPLRALGAGILTIFEPRLNMSSFGERITGIELTDRLFALAENKGYTVFMLGGRKRDNQGNQVSAQESDDMATAAASVAMTKYPKLRIIGSSSQFSRESSDDEVTKEYMRNSMKRARVSSIDILLVAYNPIDQEKWAVRNAKHIPAKISIGIGRAFDYLSDEMRQPPAMYERLHLAWIYTLFSQPWRYKRMLKSFPIFPLKVFFDSLKGDN